MSLKADIENKIKTSKKLAYLLRHGAVKRKLNIRSDGFIDVQEILKELKNCTLDDLKQIVENDYKKRYKLNVINNTLMIKACQGHTIEQVNSLSLKILTDVSFDIVHGTFLKNYEDIQQKGLSRMKRNHIHFSKGLNYIRGLRKSAEVFIFIDFSHANKDGIVFYESENGVILSPGNSDGFIEKKYFVKVMTKTGQML